MLERDRLRLCRFKKITRPDSSVWQLRPIQVVGLTAGSSSESNPAPLAPLSDAVATYTDPRNHVTTMQVDRFGYLTRVTDPLGYVARYQRDSNGLVTRRSEPAIGSLGRPTTLFEYDERGNATKITRPDGASIEYTYYNAFSQPTTASGLGQFW